MIQRKSHEERRVEIADTALSLAAEQGVGTVTTQAIADRMGVSQATVFRHFKNRDEIFREAIIQAKKRVYVRIHPIFEDKETRAATRLENLITTHLAVIEENRGIPAVLFSDRLHQDDPVLKADVRTSMKNYAAKISILIDEGIKDGSFKPDVDATVMGQAVVTMIQGLLLRWSLFDYGFELKPQAAVIWAFFRPSLQPKI